MRLMKLMGPTGPRLLQPPPPARALTDDIPVNVPPSFTSISQQPQLVLASAGMESVRLEDLTLRVGEPYWMLHQGNCEHVFTVDEIRFVFTFTSILASHSFRGSRADFILPGLDAHPRSW